MVVLYCALVQCGKYIVMKLRILVSCTIIEAQMLSSRLFEPVYVTTHHTVPVHYAISQNLAIQWSKFRTPSLKKSRSEL